MDSGAFGKFQGKTVPWADMSEARGGNDRKN